LKGQDIKQLILDSGLKIWQVAYAFGISDGNFSRKLRKDFSEADTQKVLQIIDKLKTKN
jgi:predicted XRE-type DNA-binding protein